jgi:LacI family transcriptional regulator
MGWTDQIQLNPKSDIPLVVQVVDQLTWLIANGQLARGELLPSMRHLATSLGVNMHTVRHAYGRLAEQGLVEIRRRRGTVVLDFDPAAVVRHRSPPPSFLVGVLLPAPTSLYRDMLQGIHQACAEEGWMPLIGYVGDNPQTADRYFHQLVVKGVEGMIVVSVPVLLALGRFGANGEGFPVVHIDSPAVKDHCILGDNEKAAYLSTKHLIEHGQSTVAMITPPLHWANVALCHAGYQRALQQADIAVQPEWVVEVADFSPESGHAGLLELNERGLTRHSAFFASDLLALGALHALKEIGCSVPEQFIFTSYDDIAEAALVTPAITTSTFPARDIGWKAVKQLANIKSRRDIEGGQTLLDTELIVRESCGCNRQSTLQK